MVDPLPPDMLDIPASVIEQIPLGVQIIDLASLKASDRPQGQSLYPDSIIPVSSFTHGQHPDTGSAQTVETDGNHALKVAVSSASTSGGPFKSIEINSGINIGAAGTGTLVLLNTNPETSLVLRRFYLSFYIDPAVAPAAGHGALDVGVTTFNSGTRVARLFTLPFSFTNVAGDHDGMSGSAVADFANGLDLIKTLNDGSNQYQFYANRNAPAGIFLNWSAVFSDT